MDLEIIGKSEQCQGYTGADLASLVKEASRESFKDLVKSGDMDKQCLVTNDHFNRAVAKIKPSVSEKVINCNIQYKISMAFYLFFSGP